MKKYLNNKGERVLTEQEFDELVNHLIETGQTGSNTRHIKKTEATPNQHAGRRAYRLKTREKENARAVELRKANPERSRAKYDKANAKARTPEARAKRRANRDGKKEYQRLKESEANDPEKRARRLELQRESDKRRRGTPEQRAERQAKRDGKREHQQQKQRDELNPQAKRERLNRINAAARTSEARALRNATRNREAENEAAKRRRVENPEKDRLKQRRHYAKNREQEVERSRKWREENPESVKRTTRKRYKKQRENPAEVLTMSITCRFRDILKLSGAKKYKSAREFGLGTAKDLQDYIESQWLPGMSWDNYGKDENMSNKGKWEVDHIMPCRGKGVDMNDPAHQYAIWNYRNFQPLWSKDNIRKFNKVNPEARALFDELVAEFEGGEAA